MGPKWTNASLPPDAIAQLQRIRERLISIQPTDALKSEVLHMSTSKLICFIIQERANELR